MTFKEVCQFRWMEGGVGCHQKTMQIIFATIFVTPNKVATNKLYRKQSGPMSWRQPLNKPRNNSRSSPVKECTFCIVSSFKSWKLSCEEVICLTESTLLHRWCATVMSRPHHDHTMYILFILKRSQGQNTSWVHMKELWNWWKSVFKFLKKLFSFSRYCSLKFSL